MQEVYKYYECDKKAGVQIIELPKNVLGGNDALEFSIIVDKFCSTDSSVIVVDLLQVELMNSSGLGMLVAALSKTRKQSKHLVLASIPDKILSLLKMTHLNELFTIEASIDEAISKI